MVGYVCSVVGVPTSRLVVAFRLGLVCVVVRYWCRCIVVLVYNVCAGLCVRVVSGFG